MLDKTFVCINRFSYAAYLLTRGCLIKICYMIRGVYLYGLVVISDSLVVLASGFIEKSPLMVG